MRDERRAQHISARKVPMCGERARRDNDRRQRGKESRERKFFVRNGTLRGYYSELILACSLAIAGVGGAQGRRVLQGHWSRTPYAVGNRTDGVTRVEPVEQKTNVHLEIVPSALAPC